MKKRLLSLSLAFIFTVSGYEIFATRTIQAQCGCSCSYVCSGTCNVSCTDCTIAAAWAAAVQCCEGERQNVEPHCIAGGPVN